MNKNAKLLKDIKCLTVKEIQQKVFPDRVTYVYEHIWKSKYSRHRTINYQIAYGLLPIVGKQACPFCARAQESIMHILLDCGKLTRIRDQVLAWLRCIKENTELGRKLVITGEEVTDEIERYILSEYKIAIWIARNKIKFENEKLIEQNIINRIECNVRFFINNMLRRN